jgi:ADP-L-glycero-D-manno-heptose 6-epimerase
MNLPNDKYLILTGGAGFIGSGVLRYLNDKGFDNIVVVDDFDQTEKWKNLVGKKFSFALKHSQLFSWLEGKESEIFAFIHLGACSSTVERDSGYLIENNYQFTVKLAEYALKNEHRFIYASSAATYGDGLLGFSDSHDVLDQFKPLNMYGYSKHLFDLWAKREGVLDSIVGLKFFNVFGPNEYHKDRMCSFVLKMLPKALKEKEISLFKSSDPENYSDGGQCRDFLYVKDVARMTAQFLFNSEGGIFNIGSEKASTWNELADAMLLALKDDSIKIKYIDMPEDLIGKYQNYTCADMKKYLSKGLEGTKYNLQEAVDDYINQYLLEGKTW